MNYRFSDFAVDELRTALRYYSTQDRGLAVGIVEEVARSVAVLLANPHLGQPIRHDYRHLPLRRFPYFLIYQLSSDTQLISIVSVCHQSRRPDYWQQGVREAPALYDVAA